MAKTDYRTIDDYIAAQTPAVQEVLQAVRRTIHEAVPGAEEVISYQVPAIRSHGWIFYFSAYRNHFSLACPPSPTLYEAFAERLAGYKLSKSTIQFPYSGGVPVDLIRDMAKHRLEENLAAEAARPEKPAG